MRAEQPAGFGENPLWIGERADRIVQAAQERLPAFTPAEGFLCAGSLNGRPRPVCGHLDQRNLIARPLTRRPAVDAQCGDPRAVLY